MVILIGLFIIGMALPEKFDWVMVQSKLFLTSLFELKGWVLVVAIFFSLLGVIKLLEFILSFYPNYLAFHSYKQDTFKKTLWKWKWHDEEIEQLWCYCPNCNQPLAYQCDYLLYKTDFLCPTCEKQVASYDGDNINYVLTKIKTEIRRVVQRSIKEENEK